VKVWGKRARPSAGDRKGVGMEPKVQQFLMFFKNNSFTVYYLGLKYLLKNMFLNYCKVYWCVRRWFSSPLAMPRSIYRYTILQSSSSFGPILFIRWWVQFFGTSVQCHRREPPNLISLLENGVGDMKLVFDQLFALMLHSCSLPRAQYYSNML